MNENVDPISRWIMRFAPRIDFSVLSALLAIRRTLGDGETVWEKMVADTWKGAVMPAIMDALRLIAPPYPFLNDLLETIGDAHPDERDLRELIACLSSFPTEDGSLARMYEALLSKRQTAAPLTHTPARVACLLADLLEIKGGSAYDPNCGSGSMLCEAVRAEGLRLYGQTADQESYQTCQMNAYLHQLSIDLGGKPASPLTEDLHDRQRFDYILANVPFNMPRWYDDWHGLGDDRWRYGFPPRSNANFAWLQHIVSHMAEDGRAAVILPNGTLATQVRAERVIRQRLLNDGIVEAIIALPGRIFANTKVPCCIWVLRKAETPQSTILLVDARRDRDAAEMQSLVLRHRRGALQGKTDWYAVVSIEEVAQKRYVLSPNLYTNSRPIVLSSIQQRQARLASCIDELYARLDDDRLRQWKNKKTTEYWDKDAITSLYQVSGGLAKRKEAFGRGTEMVDVNTVIQHAFLPDKLTARVEATEKEQWWYQVSAGDILLNRTSESVEQLACGCVVPDDRGAVYGGYIKRLSPWVEGMPTPHPFYMAGYLRSAIYRREVERVSPVYTTRASMNMDRLSEILVYYPDMATQKELGETLFAVARYQQETEDQPLKELLAEFERLLIEQYITYPILRSQAWEDGNR